MSDNDWVVLESLVAFFVEAVGQLRSATQKKPRQETSPGSQLKPFRFGRKMSSDEEETSESPPVHQLSRGEFTPVLKQYPVGFSPTRRGTVYSASISSESVPEREYAWRPPRFPKDQETKTRLESILRANILMQRLSPEGRATITEACEQVTVAAGTRVVLEGEIGDCCYIVESGQLSCDMQAKGHRCFYGPGQSFGELALILDRATFKKIVLSASQPKQRLFRDFIEKVSIFSTSHADELPMDSIDRLATCSHNLKYCAGDVILEIGFQSAERYVYLLQAGEVWMLLDGDVVEVVKPNSFFGERSALLDECPIADAVAHTDCKIFRVPETVLCSMPQNFLDTLREFARDRHA